MRIWTIVYNYTVLGQILKLVLRHEFEREAREYHEGRRLRKMTWWAMAESFFATLECELIERQAFHTQAEARMAVFQFIEGWYNTRRRHSALGYLSPNDFERAATAAGVRPGGDSGPDQEIDPVIFLIVEPDVQDRPPGLPQSLGNGEGYVSNGCRAPRCWCTQPSTVH